MGQSQICRKQFSINSQVNVEGSSHNEVWLAKGFATAADAVDALRDGHIPSSHTGLETRITVGQGLFVTLRDTSPQEIADGHDGGGGAGEGKYVYEISVAYDNNYDDEGPSGSFEEGQWSFTGNTGSINRKYALPVTLSDGASLSPYHMEASLFPKPTGTEDPPLKLPELNYVINLETSKDGTIDIKGVELPIAGEFHWSIEKRYTRGTVNMTTLQALTKYKFTVNDDPFGSFAKGEVCFVGADVRSSGAQFDYINYEFEISPNFLNDTFPALDQMTNKYGWDYFWVQFEPAVKGGVSGAKPKAWYIDRIMPFVPYGPMLTMINSGTLQP